MISHECGIYRKSYLEDTTVHRVPLARYALFAFLAFMFFVYPFVASGYMLALTNLILISSVAVLGLNLLVGFAGQISIGHGAFVGVGAFASAVYMEKFGLPFFITVPLAGFTAAGVGLIFGLPSVRIKGIYLAIATLAAQQIIIWFLTRSFLVGTGAYQTHAPSVFGFELKSEFHYYYLFLPVTIVAVMFIENLTRTRIGRAFVAIRDRDIAASVIGVNLAYYKLLAFAIASFYAGIAGGLWAHYLKAVDAELFTIGLSIQYLAMMIIGGMGSIPGAIFGSAFVTLLTPFARTLVDSTKSFLPVSGLAIIFSSAQVFIFGLIIVVFMIFEPEGLAKIWRNTKNYFRLWPFSY